MSVGFIGLGNMGAHMARNLLVNNVKLMVFDVIPAATYEFKKSGATVANSPAQVASSTDTVITMLPSSPEVQAVYLGKNGISNNIKKDTLCIDCSTIDPSVSVQVAAQLAEKNASYIDAPVSGGVLAARDAGLTFMVGGVTKDFERATPLLKHMGKNVHHCGDIGNGQAVKICNNLLLAVSMIGTAEAMNLGQRLGLDPAVLAKIINSSSGRCWSSELYNPVPGIVPGVPSSRDYEGGFSVKLMAKDLGLAQQAAADRKTPTLFGSIAHQFYRLLAGMPEYSTKDFSSVYKFIHGGDKKAL